jgi:hypothetical protein
VARARALLVAAVLALLGCGDDETTTTSGSAEIIRSFEVTLPRDHVARLSFNLTTPAGLQLEVEGYPHGASGVLPVGNNAYGSGPGSAEVNFEQGEFDFTESSQLIFRLLARTREGVRSKSAPVIVKR